MDASLPSHILGDNTFRPRTDILERSALERELERLHGECWGWALACCAWDREVAEDVLQTAYLRVLSGSASFRGASTPKTWIFGVIRLTAKAESRRRMFWRARNGSAALAMEIPDGRNGADVDVECGERRETLIGALATLSTRQRQVLQLVFYHDMTIEEAAVAMQVSLGSARTHYARGKKALAEKLGEMDR
jgi:RNA polymerase sigma factor (sigma-70 family)